MAATNEIPCVPLDIRNNSSGSLPDVAIHQRGRLFHQESTYAHLWLFGVMLLSAAVICILPWNTMAQDGIKLKYWIAGGLAWGGICVLAVYFLRNTLGQTIIIDPYNRTLSIRSNKHGQTIAWDDILGVQLCHQVVREDSELTGYQLNLVWKDGEGAMKRHCLMKHSNRRFAESLGHRYESLFQFKFIESC